MSDIKEEDIIFGKAIGQIIHDIRNPLNTIIGFSSILQIDDTLNDEAKNFLKKIFQSGMAIEKQLSNIDFYMMNEIETESIEFEVGASIKNYINTFSDIITEKQILVDYLFNKEIYINYSLELFNKIIDNLLQFSFKGFRTTDERNIEIFIKKDNANSPLTILYSDSSPPVFIEENYFTFEEILKSRRGLGVMYIEKYVRLNKGTIDYKYGKKWQELTANYNIKMKSNHGFILKIPVLNK